MITSRIRMIFLEKELWHRSPLMELQQDLVVSERRVGKSSNIDVERSRYSLTCHFLEQTASELHSLGQTKAIVDLDMGYIETLRYIKNISEKDTSVKRQITSGRLFATVFPPQLLRANLDGWEALGTKQNEILSPSVQKRLEKITNMVNAGVGLIEVVSPFQDIVATGLLSGHAIRQDDNKIDAPASIADEDENLVTQADSLRREINSAIAENGYVNFTNPNHSVITQVLHEYVYQPRKSPASIRVIFGDGSESEPFRFEGLGEPDKINQLAMLDAKQIHASLISMRHPEQDLFVDTAWFLNQRVSAPRPFSETEQLCFERTLQALDQLSKPIVIHLYQTGLQPAVVGFFRAFLHFRQRMNNKHSIWVQPMLFRHTGRYQTGKIWW